MINYIKALLKIPKYYKKIDNIDISPIFILGGNRSGTSLISSIISQNPEVEGIFQDNNVPLFSTNKHVLSYCSSHHIWDFLLKIKSNWAYKNEGVLWGHPKNISKYYKDKPKNNRESLLLINALQHYRTTDRIPLINSHFNMFRIGLIKKIFPNAKFVLIIKNYDEIIKSCYHKWSEQNIKIDYPKIGLHWYTLNSCCIYDLIKYASCDYCIIDFNQLFNNQEKTINLLNNNLYNIGLHKFDYNLKIISKKNRFLDSKDNYKFQFEKLFGWIENIIMYENKITKKSKSEN